MFKTSLLHITSFVPERVSNMEEREDGKDKSDVCRLCLGTTDVTVPIGQHDDKATSIIEKIQYCTSLVVRVHHLIC